MLDILYLDQHLVAINKPHGLLVHRSKYADQANVFAVQELRNQLGCYVYPAHRLDRKTGGLLLFALNPAVNSLMQQQFADNLVKKTYLAIVRGHTPQNGTINYALTNDDGKTQDAVTNYRTIEHVETNVAFGKFSTSRYSLIEATPQTGRLHQIRKHFAHIFHPIIADRPHGCNKQNRLFKELYNMDTMLLHASSIEFKHPVTNNDIKIKAPLQSEFTRSLNFLGFNFTFASCISE